MRGFLSTLVVLTVVALICISAQDVGVVPERNVDAQESPYFNAARVGNVETIKWQLDAGHDVNIQNADGWTPLHFAVDAYQPHAVALMLRRGANPNIQDKDGWTPLMFAAHSGNTILVGMLLDAHADPLLANKDGFGAHSIAQFEGFPAIAKTIATEGVTAAMVTEDFPTMLLMIHDGAPVNARNAAGWTPLIAAVSAGHEETVLALLNTPEVDVNLAENDGWTPLMFAANNNRVQITQWLLERGADVNIKSRMGFSCTSIARDRNFKDLSALLKRASAIRTRYLAELQQEAAPPQEMPQQVQEVGVDAVLAQQSPADYSRGQAQQQQQQQQRQQPAVRVAVAGPAKAAVEPEQPKKKSGWLW